MKWWLRLGWAEARRNRARTLLLASFVFVPVALMTLGAILVESTWGQPPLELVEVSESGQCMRTIDSGSINCENPPVELSTIEHWVDSNLFLEKTDTGGRQEIGYNAEGRASLLSAVSAHNPAETFAELPVREGRMPANTAEVALPTYSLNRLGLDVGDVLETEAPAANLTIVGEFSPSKDFSAMVLDTAILTGEWAENGRGNAWSPIVWAVQVDHDTLPAGTMSPPAPPGVTSHLPGMQDGGTTNGFTPMDAVPVGGLVAFLWLGCVSTAGMAISMRRRRRDLGLLAATGADPKDLRSAAIGEGLAIGIAGAVAGVMVGLAAGFLITPTVQELLSYPYDTTKIPFAIIALCGLMGLGAGTLSAAIASIPVRKQTPVDLLRESAPPPRKPAGTFLMGTILLAVAALIYGFSTNWTLGSSADAWTLHTGTYSAHPTSPSLSTALVVVGLLIVGALLLVAGMVQILPLVSQWLPFAWRYTGAELGKQGLRVSAVAVASALTIAGMVMGVSWGVSTDGGGPDNSSLTHYSMTISAASWGKSFVDGQLANNAEQAAVDAVETDLVAGGFQVGPPQTTLPPHLNPESTEGSFDAKVPPERRDAFSGLLQDHGLHSTIPGDGYSAILVPVGLVIASLISLGVLGIALALMRVDSRRSERTMTELGVSPLTNRVRLGAQGALVLLCAAIPATVASTCVLWATAMSTPPIWLAFYAVVGLPTLGFLLGALLARPAVWNLGSSVEPQPA